MARFPANKLYLITGPTGKRYIGQTIRPIERRWAVHVSHALAGRRGPLAAAIRKYGSSKFTIEELGICGSKKEMDAWERTLIKILGTKSPQGYNLTDGGDGPAGYSHTRVAREKIAAANRSRLIPPMLGKKMPGSFKRSRRVKYSGDGNPFWGKKHSVESRKKMSAAALRRAGRK